MSNGNGLKKANANAYHDFFHDNGHRSPSNTEGASLCRQEFAEECDINALMKRYEGHDIGSIMRAAGEPRYIDFTEAPDDLMGYLRLQKEAETAFMTLPAIVRREFDNDPVLFVDFAADPANLDQMREWGLAPPAKAEEVPKVAPVPPPPQGPIAAPGAAPAPPAHGST